MIFFNIFLDSSHSPCMNQTPTVPKRIFCPKHSPLNALQLKRSRRTRGVRLLNDGHLIN